MLHEALSAAGENSSLLLRCRPYDNTLLPGPPSATARCPLGMVAPSTRPTHRALESVTPFGTTLYTTTNNAIVEVRPGTHRRRTLAASDVLCEFFPRHS